PAGLDRIDDWQISTMAGKYLNLYNYSQISALYPTRIGTFGIGYGGSRNEFSFPSSEVIVIGDEMRIIPTGEVSGKYDNTAVLLTYANHLSPNFWNLNDIELGGSLKLLAQDLAATGIPENTASGMELNLGALYPVNQKLRFGAAVLDALPASMGGKITWSSGLVETLPATLKLGFSYRPNPGLELLLDQDRQITRRDVPTLTHVGAEWFLSDAVAVRAGLDQSLSADTSGNPAVSNDLSLGLGLMYNGFRFDYAYHTYNNLTDNATQYFSLTYGVWPVKLATQRVAEYFTVKTPENRSFLFDETVVLKGEVIDRRVSEVRVRGAKVPLGRGGEFETELTLQVGRNRILLEAFDSRGKLLKKTNWELVRLPTFWDVDPEYWARSDIGKLAVIDVILGYPNGAYNPDDMIVRSEMVALLMRSLGTGETEVKGLFKDVKRRHWAAKYIETANDLGVVEGYEDRTFQPGKAVNRAEGATIIARFNKLPPIRVLESPYSDVPGRHWAARAITQLKESGSFDFIKGNKFNWRAKLTRGEVAYVLARTKYINDKLNKLFDE
ncbi:MAG TPA: S-layer homology domain-containing protein, partial [Candidatus Sulfotelmatobacter sp.]|nr:S-layer homology domain-containing protein [Candidatus Sulfotelmatobacter sp.]